jgi:predicted outer membrane repeat protein
MYNDGSSPALSHVRFENNSASGSGGGIYNTNAASPALSNVTFLNNSVGFGGGGMSNNGGSAPVLSNTSFLVNQARLGGGMQNSDSSPILTNCSFTGNSAVAGGALYNANSAPILTNSILWGNGTEISDSTSTPVVTYSDIQGGYTGTGNIDDDPLFVDAANGDLHLGTGSPCIDAGDNGAQNLPPYDFEGDDRILDGDDDGTATVDMGVDEFVYSGQILIEVEIDIKPKTKANTIKLGTGAKVPVAILTTAEFDAADVDPATVLFADAGAVFQSTTMEDVDDDGDLDLLLYFKTKDLNLLPTDKTATLEGETIYGDQIEGTDKVKVIP